jgi:uncharacterized protein
MNIMHEVTGNNGIFFVKANDRNLAEMTYSLAEPDMMIIEHTWVDESLRGKSIGKQLVDDGVQFAAEHHYRIIPLCTFAKAVLEKKNDQHKNVPDNTATTQAHLEILNKRIK